MNGIRSLLGFDVCVRGECMELIVSDLHKAFDRTIIADNISFKMEKGKVYSLLGRNGVGKTTLMKMIAGMMPYDSGKIKLINQEKNIDHIYYIPENPVFLDYLTGYEQLEFVMKLNDLEMSTSDLEKFILDRKIDSFVNDLIVNYSNGMKHQLALAMAFISQPKLVMLDEPLVSLDPINIHYTKEHLVQYARSGNIVLLSTHMLPIAHQVSDEIFILNDGEMNHIKNELMLDELEGHVLHILSDH